jgi:ribosomal protein S18 acetylase RimI-like enzyme
VSKAASALQEMGLRRALLADLPAVVALQQAAYARNRVLLGVEPLPLQADYREILTTMEVWLSEAPGTPVPLRGALILEARPEDLLIWSIACDPAAQSSGLGTRLLTAAEARARELGQVIMRLYTGSKFDHLITWYSRHGYEIERVQVMSDRSITHMVKRLSDASSR